MAIIQCTDSLVLPFSATFVVPASFEFVDSTKFSIAVDTEGLTVYKEIVDYPVTLPVIGPCNMEVEGSVVAKLGQIKVSGIISYRVAANGLQTDQLEIPPELESIVNVDKDIWSSADGFVEVKSGSDKFMTVGYTLPDTPLVPGLLTVTLKSLVVGSTTTEDRSDDKIVTLEGEFTLSYK